MSLLSIEEKILREGIYSSEAVRTVSAVFVSRVRDAQSAELYAAYILNGFAQRNPNVLDHFNATVLFSPKSIPFHDAAAVFAEAGHEALALEVRHRQADMAQEAKKLVKQGMRICFDEKTTYKKRRQGIAMYCRACLMDPRAIMTRFLIGFHYGAGGIPGRVLLGSCDVAHRYFLGSLSFEGLRPGEAKRTLSLMKKTLKKIFISGAKWRLSEKQMWKKKGPIFESLSFPIEEAPFTEFNGPTPLLFAALAARMDRESYESVIGSATKRSAAQAMYAFVRVMDPSIPIPKQYCEEEIVRTEVPVISTMSDEEAEKKRLDDLLSEIAAEKEAHEIQLEIEDMMSGKYGNY